MELKKPTTFEEQINLLEQKRINITKHDPKIFMPLTQNSET